MDDQLRTELKELQRQVEALSAPLEDVSLAKTAPTFRSDSVARVLMRALNKTRVMLNVDSAWLNFQSIQRNEPCAVSDAC